MLTIVILSRRYQGLVVLAVAQSALATIITIICRTHIEPLNSKAAIAFAIKNFRYFGLPMQLILLAFVNTILALILWIFGTHGLFAGLFASCASGIGMWCVLFVSDSVFSWKNEELSEKVRQKRETLRKKIWKTLFPFNVLHLIGLVCKAVWARIMYDPANAVCKKMFKDACNQIKKAQSSPKSQSRQNARQVKASSSDDSESVDLT